MLVSEYFILKTIFMSAGVVKCDNLYAEDHCVWFHLRNITWQYYNCVGCWVNWSGCDIITITPCKLLLAYSWLFVYIIFISSVNVGNSPTNAYYVENK